MESLTVRDVAALKGCSEQYVRALIKKGVLASSRDAQGAKHLVSVASLDVPLQRKWYKRQGVPLPAELRGSPKPEPPKILRPLEFYSASEREQIDVCIQQLERWQHFRAVYDGPALEADAAFVLQERLCISIKPLYRRWSAYKGKDWSGLIDNRGKPNKGKSDVPREIRDLFEYFYLDERGLNIKKCYEVTRDFLKQERPDLLPELPSYATAHRWANAMPLPVACLAREGEKAFNDRFGVFVDRLYDGMISNDYWIADGHRIDVITKSEDGKETLHRLTLSAFIDARSGIYVGWVLTDNPSSEATLLALRKAIMRYGIPRYLYVDNGREYLNHDIGGMGHRARARKVVIKLPTPILSRLGITMTNALPRNAQAKAIEREFRNFTFLSQLFDTWLGSNVVVKPEKLKQNLKDGKIPTDSELYAVVESMIDGYFNCQPYNGKVVADRGKPKLEVYRDNLPAVVLKAAEDDLTLMMMRSTRMQTVGRDGVYVTVSGERVYYFDDQLLMMQGRKVFVRYDPEIMEEVRVYDENEVFLKTAPLRRDVMESYFASKENISKALKAKRHWRRITKKEIEDTREKIASLYGGHISILDIIVRAANINREGMLVPAATAYVVRISVVMIIEEDFGAEVSPGVYEESGQIAAKFAEADEITLKSNNDSTLDLLNTEIYVSSGKTFTLESGNVVGTGRYLIYAEGSIINIDGGGISGGQYSIDASDSDVTISGGTIRTDIYGAVGVSVLNSTLDISGGEIIGYFHGLDASGSDVTISGGMITETSETTINSWNPCGIRALYSTLDISGGDISGYVGIEAHGSDVTITDGTFTGTSSGVYTYPNSTLDVSGGNISGDVGIKAEESEVTISGGTISGPDWGGIHIYPNSTLDVSGGNISGRFGITAEESEVTISGGTITGADWGGISCSAAIISNTPTIKGGNYLVYDPGKLNTSITHTDPSITLGQTQIDGTWYMTYNGVAPGIGGGSSSAVIIIEEDFGAPTGGGTTGDVGTYTYDAAVLNAAFAAYDSVTLKSENGSTLDVVSTGSDGIEIPAGEELIVTSGTITRSADVLVYVGYPTICVDGTLTVTGGTIENLDNGIAVYANSATVNLEDCAINNPSSGTCVYASGTSIVSITGCTINGNPNSSGYLISTFDDSDVTISDSTISTHIEVSGNSTVTLGNGTSAGYVRASDDSHVNITGGTISYIGARGNAVVSVSGNNTVIREDYGSAILNSSTVPIQITGRPQISSLTEGFIISTDGDTTLDLSCLTHTEGYTLGTTQIDGRWYLTYNGVAPLNAPIATMGATLPGFTPPVPAGTIDPEPEPEPVASPGTTGSDQRAAIQEDPPRLKPDDEDDIMPAEDTEDAEDPDGETRP